MSPEESLKLLGLHQLLQTEQLAKPGRRDGRPRPNGGYGPNEAPPAAARSIVATPFVWIDPAAIPRRQWLYGRHYSRQFISQTVAFGGVGKSLLAITEALAIVTASVI